MASSLMISLIEIRRCYQVMNRQLFHELLASTRSMIQANHEHNIDVETHNFLFDVFRDKVSSRTTSTRIYAVYWKLLLQCHNRNQKYFESIPESVQMKSLQNKALRILSKIDMDWMMSLRQLDVCVEQSNVWSKFKQVFEDKFTKSKLFLSCVRWACSMIERDICRKRAIY